MYRYRTLRVSLNHICLGNINIDHEIDTVTYILQNIINMMAYGLNGLTTPPQNSACHMEEQLHWSLPVYTWLPYMVR